MRTRQADHEKPGPLGDAKLRFDAGDRGVGGVLVRNIRPGRPATLNVFADAFLLPPRGEAVADLSVHEAAPAAGVQYCGEGLRDVDLVDPWRVIVMHAGLERIPARQDRGARRIAQRCRREGVGEAHAFAHQPEQVRRDDARAVARAGVHDRQEIVDHDEDEIALSGRLCGRRPGKSGGGRSGENVAACEQVASRNAV